MQTIVIPRVALCPYIWFYLEYPRHSSPGRIIYSISIILTLLSCISLAVESLPHYRNKWKNVCKTQTNTTLNLTTVVTCSDFFYSPLFIIQSICVAYFTLEYIWRFLSTPSYRRFFLSFLNWIDLAAILPYYVFLMLASIRNYENDNIISFYGLRILLFIRAMKLYLVLGRIKSLRIITTTLRESSFDFLVMFIVLTFFAFMFGSAVYFFEQLVDSDIYASIPLSLYWGIITITGVGYDISLITNTWLLKKFITFILDMGTSFQYQFLVVY